MKTQIVSAFMKIFDDIDNCDLDEYDRPKSEILLCCEKYTTMFTQSFHYNLLAYMKTQIKGLTIVCDEYESYDLIRMKFRDCEVYMDYCVEYSGENKIIFTKLPFDGDERGFVSF